MSAYVRTIPGTVPDMTGRVGSENDSTHTRLAQIKYLVVDHIGFRARTAVNEMKTAGLRRVEICDSAEIALKLLETGLIGAAIVAFDLAAVDGPEFTRRVRHVTDPVRRQVPIIMVASIPSIDALGRAKNAGVNEFLATPFSVADLYGRVYRAVVTPKPFVVSEVYVGPCRRLKDAPLPDLSERCQGPLAQAGGSSAGAN